MTAQELFDERFNSGGDPRSPQYKEGCLHILLFKLGEIASQPCPYKEGTAYADAWFYGCREGNEIYNRYRFDVEQKI